MRAPDVAVTRESDVEGVHAVTEPVVLIEILSPSNEAETRANVWAYATIPSVKEILLVRSTCIAAELLRREADGGWPANPTLIGEDGRLTLDSIGFESPLAILYEGTRFVSRR